MQAKPIPPFYHAWLASIFFADHTTVPGECDLYQSAAPESINAEIWVMDMDTREWDYNSTVRVATGQRSHVLVESDQRKLRYRWRQERFPGQSPQYGCWGYGWVTFEGEFPEEKWRSDR
jgi:hypothetical protein